jgi:hypothetical protein
MILRKRVYASAFSDEPTLLRLVIFQFFPSEKAEYTVFSFESSELRYTC